jgi:hypothetical protein
MFNGGIKDVWGKQEDKGDIRSKNQSILMIMAWMGGVSQVVH